MKKILFACLLAAGWLGASTQYPKPQGYVSDFAGIIDSSIRQGLENEISEFERSTSIEIAVATVPSLDGDTIEDYAVRLFKEWGIGKKGKDNGILILVAPNERKVRIEVGYGLEAALNDARAGDIIRHDMAPNFKLGHYGVGLQEAVEHIIRNLPEYMRNPGMRQAPSGNTIKMYLQILFIVFVVGFGVIPITTFGGLGALIWFWVGRASVRTWGFYGLPLCLWLDWKMRHARRGSFLYRQGYSGQSIDWGGGFGGGGFSGGGGGFGGGSSGGGGASGGW